MIVALGHPMKVVVKGALAKLVAGDPNRLHRLLSFRDPEAKWDERYRSGEWDGVHRYFDTDNLTFPAGFVRRVEKHCRENGLTFELVDSSPDLRCKVDRNCLFGKTLRPRQIEAVITALREKRCRIKSPTGSGKTEIIAALSWHLIRRGMWPILVPVPGRTLARQSVKRLTELLGEPVGLYGGGLKHQLQARVVVGVPESLVKGAASIKDKKRHPNPIARTLLRNAKALIMDEIQHGGSDTWWAIGTSCPAYVRIGLSARPEEERGKEIKSSTRQEGLTGPIVVEIPQQELIDAGHLAKPVVFCISDPRVFGPNVNMAKQFPGFLLAKLRFKHEHDKAVIKNPVFNRNVARLARMLVRVGLPPLIFCPRVAQIRVLRPCCTSVGVKTEELHGSHSDARRESVIEKFQNDEDFGLITSTILDEGINVPEIGSAILACGGNKLRRLIQRLGRGMRPKPGLNVLYWIDWAFPNNGFNHKHYWRRLSEYRRLGCEVHFVRNFELWMKQWEQAHAEAVG